MRAIRLHIILALALISVKLSAQTDITNKGVSITISGVEVWNVGDYTNAKDSLTHTTDGEIVSNDTFHLLGDIINRADNTVFTTNGTVRFYSDSTQQILGDSSVAFHTLLINKSDSNLKMGHGLSISNTVNFDGGHLDLNGFTLDLGQTAALVNEAEHSRVINDSGYVVAKRFLSSPSVATNIAGMGMQIGSSSNFSFTDITRSNTAQSGAGDGSIKRHWEFAPTNPNHPVSALKLHYFNADLNGMPEEELTYWQTNTGGTVWTNEGGSADTTNNIVTANSLILKSSISSIARGDCSANPVIGFADTVGICPGDSITLNAQNPGHFYSWSTGDTVQAITVGDSGTYTVTVTSVNGCVSADTIYVKEHPVPHAAFTFNFECHGDTNFFQDTSSVADSSTLYSFWDFGDPNVNNDTSNFTNPIWIYDSAGTYTITLVSTSEFGCFDSSTANVTIIPLPEVNFGFEHACADSVVTFSDSTEAPSPYSILNRSWDFGDGNGSAIASPTHIYDTTSTYFVKQIVTNNGGCVDSATQVLIIFPNPEAKFGVTGSCEGVAIEILDSSAASSGSLNYSWDFGDSTYSTLASPGKTYATDSTYEISLAVSTNQGCTARDTQSVVVNDLPVAAFTLDSVCQVDTVQFINQSSVDNASLTYAWDFGDASGSALTNPEKNYSAAGTYTVQLVVTSQYGCADSIEHVTQTHPMPQPAFSAQSECDGDAISFFNASSIASGALSYDWNFGTGTSNNTNPQFTFPTSGTHIVTLSATSNFGCVDTIADTAIVHANPVVNLGPPTIATCGSTFLLDAGNPTASFAWSSFANTQQYLVTSNGNYSVTVTDTNSCVGADTVDVLLNTTPQTDLGPDTAVCGSYTLNAYSFGATYNWSNSATDSAIVVNTSGQYWVEVTDQNACLSGDTVNVTINASPVVDLGSDTTFCQGGSVVLDAENSGSTYAWNGGITTQTRNVSTSGNYRVTVTNNFGCQDSDTAQVTVNPRPVFDLGPDTAYCGSTELQVTQNNVSYAWSTGATVDSILVDTSGTYSLTITNAFACDFADTVDLNIHDIPMISLGNDTSLCQGDSVVIDVVSTSNLSSYLWTNASTDSVRIVEATGNYSVTATDVNGCTDSDTVNVLFNNSPQPDLGADIILCLGDTAHLSTMQPSWTHAWSATNSQTDSGSVFHISDSAMVYVAVMDTMGCIGADSVLVTKLTDSLQARFLMASEVEIGDTVEFIQLSYPDPLDFLWSYGDGGTSTDSTGMHIYFLQDTFDVTLVAYNSSCADTMTKQIVIAPPSSNAKPTPVDSTEFVQSIFRSVKMFPNPTLGMITLDVELEDEISTGTITCYTLQGMPLLQEKFTGTRFKKTYDFDRLAAGMYLMNVVVGHEQRTWKFIKL